MHMTYVYGAKGGVGTSTIAATLASMYANVTSHVVLLSTAEHHDDRCSILGVHDYSDRAGDISLCMTDHPDNRVIIDGGITKPAKSYDTTILVMRNDYMSVKWAQGHTPDVVVLVTNDGGTLHEEDVRMILPEPRIVKVPTDASIARAIDAGMLTSRLPQLIGRKLTGLVTL